MSKPILFITDKTNQSFSVIEHLYRLAFQKLGYSTETISQPTNGAQLEALCSSTKNRLILHNTIGPHFLPIKDNYNIALPVHEWSEYPRQWADKLSKFDEVWVTTDHVKDLIQRAGTHAPVYLKPPPLDLENIPQKQNWSSSKPFKFYFCGEPHFRKGHHLLIPAFIKAFPKSGEAILTIKTSKNCEWESPREDIILIKEHWTRQQCLNAYQNYDCYVSASLGEGFGLPIAEAVLAGLPVATNYWGGHKSLLNNGVFFQIPHQETFQLFASKPEYYVDGQKCAMSSIESIADTLKSIVMTSAPKVKKNCESAIKHLLENYSQRAILPNMDVSLEAIIANKNSH